VHVRVRRIGLLRTWLHSFTEPCWRALLALGPFASVHSSALPTRALRLGRASVPAFRPPPRASLGAAAAISGVKCRRSGVWAVRCIRGSSGPGHRAWPSVVDFRRVHSPDSRTRQAVRCFAWGSARNGPRVVRGCSHSLGPTRNAFDGARRRSRANESKRVPLELGRKRGDVLVVDEEDLARELAHR